MQTEFVIVAMGTWLLMCFLAFVMWASEKLLGNWAAPLWVIGVFGLFIAVIFTVVKLFLALESLLVEIVEYFRYGPRTNPARIVRAQEILDAASADNMWIDLKPSSKKRIIRHLYDGAIWKQEFHLRQLRRAYDVAARSPAISEPTVEELQALVDELNANAKAQNQTNASTGSWPAAREGRFLPYELRPFLNHPLIHKAATLKNGIVVRRSSSTGTRLHIRGPWNHIDAELRAIRFDNCSSRWVLPYYWNVNHPQYLS